MAKKNNGIVLDRNQKKVLVGAGIAAAAGLAVWGLIELNKNQHAAQPPPPPPPGEANLYGLVTDKATGKGIANAGFTLAFSNGFPAETGTTDANGSLLAEGLPTSVTVTVTVKAAGYDDATASKDLVEGNNLLNISMTATGSAGGGGGGGTKLVGATGQVQDGTTSNALSGVTVTAQGQTATTNSSGVYTFSGVLGPGSTVFTYQAEGYITGTQTVDLVGGQANEIPIVAMEPAPTGNSIVFTLDTSHLAGNMTADSWILKAYKQDGTEVPNNYGREINDVNLAPGPGSAYEFQIGAATVGLVFVVMLGVSIRYISSPTYEPVGFGGNGPYPVTGGHGYIVHISGGWVSNTFSITDKATGALLAYPQGPCSLVVTTYTAGIQVTCEGQTVTTDSIGNAKFNNLPNAGPQEITYSEYPGYVDTVTLWPGANSWVASWYQGYGGYGGYLTPL